MTLNKKYYSKTTEGFYIEDVSTNIPKDAVEISEDRYNELFENQGKGMSIYPDKNGYPMNTFCVDYSKWNSELEKWELIPDEKIKATKCELETLIEKYERYTVPFQYNKLTKTQQEALMLLLEECDKLLKNVTVDTKIPEIPNFLKEPTEPLESN